MCEEIVAALDETAATYADFSAVERNHQPGLPYRASPFLVASSATGAGELLLRRAYRYMKMASSSSGRSEHCWSSPAAVVNKAAIVGDADVWVPNADGAAGQRRTPSPSAASSTPNSPTSADTVAAGNESFIIDQSSPPSSPSVFISAHGSDASVSGDIGGHAAPSLRSRQPRPTTGHNANNKYAAVDEGLQQAPTKGKDNAFHRRRFLISTTSTCVQQYSASIKTVDNDQSMNPAGGQHSPERATLTECGHRLAKSGREDLIRSRGNEATGSSDVDDSSPALAPWGHHPQGRQAPQDPAVAFSDDPQRVGLDLSDEQRTIALNSGDDGGGSASSSAPASRRHKRSHHHHIQQRRSPSSPPHPWSPSSAAAAPSNHRGHRSPSPTSTSGGEDDGQLLAGQRADRRRSRRLSAVGVRCEDDMEQVTPYRSDRHIISPREKWADSRLDSMSPSGGSPNEDRCDRASSPSASASAAAMRLRSFAIADILQHKPSGVAAQLTATSHQAQSLAALRLMDPATLEFYRRHALATAASAAAAAAAAAASGLAMSPNAAAAAAMASSANNAHLQHPQPIRSQPNAGSHQHQFQQQLPLSIQQQQHHHHLHLHQHHTAAAAAAAVAMASANPHSQFSHQSSQHPSAAAAAALMAFGCSGPGVGAGPNGFPSSAVMALFGPHGFLNPSSASMVTDLPTVQALIAAKCAGRLPGVMGPNVGHLPFDLMMMGIKAGNPDGASIPASTGSSPNNSKVFPELHGQASAQQQQQQKIVRPWDMDTEASGAASSSSPDAANKQERSKRDYRKHQRLSYTAKHRDRRNSSTGSQQLAGVGVDLIDSSCDDENPEINDRSNEDDSDDDEEEIAVEDEDSDTMMSAIASTNSACSSPSGNDHNQSTPRRVGGSGAEGVGQPSGAAGVRRSGQKRSADGASPLDALFKMTNKTFEESKSDPMTMFASRQPPSKKKRKSRTAFTNHQIFELEKRFLYQKYLSPADRDELAQALGLSNAQVITWFQNRRAKLKRDMEELKKDVESAKILKAHKAYLDNIQELGLSKIKMDKNSHELTLGKIKFNRECLLQHAERELHALRHPPPSAADLVAVTKLNLL